MYWYNSNYFVQPLCYTRSKLLQFQVQAQFYTPVAPLYPRQWKPSSTAKGQVAQNAVIVRQLLGQSYDAGQSQTQAYFGYVIKDEVQTALFKDPVRTAQ